MLIIHSSLHQRLKWLRAALLKKQRYRKPDVQMRRGHYRMAKCCAFILHMGALSVQFPFCTKRNQNVSVDSYLTTINCCFIGQQRGWHGSGRRSRVTTCQVAPTLPSCLLSSIWTRTQQDLHSCLESVRAVALTCQQIRSSDCRSLNVVLEAKRPMYKSG